MRVAMVIQAFRPVLGGAQRQIELLSPLLAARGVEVSVVTRRAPGTPPTEQIPGAVVHRLAGTAGRGPRQSAAYTALGVAKVARIAPDVIHAHDLLSPTTIALVAGRLRRAPFVTKVLSTGPRADVDRLLGKPLGRRRLDLLLHRAAGLVCLSGEVEAELAARGAPPSRLVRIPNGVDGHHHRLPTPAERAEARRALGLPEEGQVVVYCGRFAEIKRVEVILDAFSGVDAHLVLAGAGPEEAAVRARAADPQLRQRVRIVGPVEDAATVLRAADLYVSASVTEGMSNSVLEAMATGLPVVTSPASGMIELLGSDPTVLAADESALALGRLLRGALADPEWRARESARLREAALRRFSLAAVADQLVDLYTAVANGQPPTGKDRGTRSRQEGAPLAG